MLSVGVSRYREVLRMASCQHLHDDRKKIAPMTNIAPTTGRRLPIWGFILLAVGYLAAVQLIPRLTTPADSKYGAFTNTAEIVGGLWVTVGVGTVIGLVAVAVLGWWRPVFLDDRPLPRWTWVFPVVLLVGILAGTSYGNLSDKGLSYTLMLLVGCLFVGVSEELMFRGIGITAFRQAGFTEGMVALWTSVLFGLAHATNIFTEGIGALPQVLVTAVAGYFFYVTRRVSGLLIVSMIIHGLWDFGLFTNTLSTPTGAGGIIFILVDIVLAIVAVVTIRKVFPRNSELPSTTGTSIPPRS